MAFALSSSVALFLCPVFPVVDAIAAEQNPPSSASDTFRITHHDLSVAIDPATHRLRATDRVTVLSPTPNNSPDTKQTEALQFTLAPTLRVTHLAAMSGARTLPVRYSQSTQVLPGFGGDATQVITVQMEERQVASFTLQWDYEGVVHDPPREPRQLRFVTPSETSGTIGPDGVYLSSESQWYPDVTGSLPTFHVAVSLPSGWSAVTHGREVLASGEQAGTTSSPHRSEWEVPEPTEALTLVANQFVRSVRMWQDPSGRAVRLETDFLPDNATLSAEYLDASGRYLEAYTKILGSYPFDKFAVVENFFASGLGMPSFTLLGSGSIKRHYTQPYALGHEIVHSWIGNAIFNRPESGNWVEGLTTYLANYYYDELTGHVPQARDQRRQMVAAYPVYVAPEQDYPVGQFMRKVDQKDNAIGYQKAAMVFHALRQEISDAAFWAGIARLGREHRWRHLAWADLERIFEAEHGRSLRWFFAQWVERAGAPELTVTATRASAASSVEIAVRQREPFFRASLPLLFLGKNGAQHSTTMMLTGATDTTTISLPFEPTHVVVDPDAHLFRRLSRGELPPMLNLLATDTQRTVVLTHRSDGEEASVYRRIVERLTGSESAGASADEAPRTELVERLSDGASKAAHAQGSLLFLGADQAAAWAQEADPVCAQSVTVGEKSVSVVGTAYDAPGLALLINCPRRHDGRPADGRMATWFFGTAPDAAGRVARLLFFYGWQSYLVFRDGAVVARGEIGDGALRIPVR
ncbi:MAG: M1 family aminopeptidase [Nitrospiraceae bacterium]